MTKRVVYIGGNINNIKAKDVIERFNTAKKELESIGYKVLTPIRSKCMTTAEMVEKEKYNFEPNEIVHRDLNDIKQADLLVAMMAIPGIGLSMEIAFARSVMDIPVIVVTDNPKVYNHYWIKVFATKVVKDIEEAVDHIKGWKYYV